MTQQPATVPTDADEPPAPPVPPVLRVKKQINRTLSQLVGYRLTRIPPPRAVGPTVELPPEPVPAEEIAERMGKVAPADRLVTAPAFVLSTVRSGSTLLRLVLDSHPEICAPHELHLRHVKATVGGTGKYALKQLNVEGTQLRDLLWDRLLHRELVRAGKSQFVNKTPNDSMIWSDIVACWPDAKFIYLHRHPKAILDSWYEARKSVHTYEQTAEDVYAYTVGMTQAREARGGLVVRYEDLTADPERETRRICEYLGLEWAPQMLQYGDARHEGLKRGLGDWSEKMRSGRIQEATAPKDVAHLPFILHRVAREWGYEI